MQYSFESDGNDEQHFEIQHTLGIISGSNCENIKYIELEPNLALRLEKSALQILLFIMLQPHLLLLTAVLKL